MSTPGEWGSKVTTYIWGRNLAGASWASAIWFHAMRILFVVLRDLRQGNLNLRAMGLVYTTLLSIVPLLAISFSVLKGFGVHNEVAPLVYDFLSPLGAKGGEIADKIFEFVENTRVGVLSSVGIVLLLYTALSMMQKIEAALNFIWHVTRSRRLSQRFSDYVSVLLIGPVLAVASTGLSGVAMNSEFVEYLSSFEPIGTVIRLIAVLVPLALAVAAFSFIYIFVPNTRVRPVSAMVGGLTAAVLWKITGWAFAVFVVASGRYEAVYSAFATFIVIMIWLYLSWLILMIGAAVAFYHQSPAFVAVKGEWRGLSPRVSEQLALLVLRTVAARFYAGSRPPTLGAIADACGVTTEVAATAIASLERGGFVVAVDGEAAGYLPGRPPETTSLAEVLEAVRAAGEDESVGVASLARDPAVGGAAQAVAAAVEGALSGRTVKDLLGSGGLKN